ncbi:AsnC family transcriptional regulator [Ralstonia sp. UBA689]|uniref:AsnC family transcriptional regulator n=1 Tax=Ralstonia sp. UBA689 TaxID=1947373 RepID=UPI0026015088|nr:AsnC family transcriptional regulator [Ralstonia sp. UBA689]
MTASAFGFCMAVQRAHASLRLKLDDALGTHYGIDFCDFALLDWLASTAAGEASLLECVRPVGLPRPAVLKRVRALEKIGLIERQGTDNGRRIALRPAGKTLVRNARETIGYLCEGALEAARAAIEPAPMAPVETALHAFAHARAPTAL